MSSFGSPLVFTMLLELNSPFTKTELCMVFLGSGAMVKDAHKIICILVKVIVIVVGHNAFLNTTVSVRSGVCMELKALRKSY